MKYIKKFNEEYDMPIEYWCRKNLVNYTINEDNTVDVSVLVDISHNELERIPIQFGIVNGEFYCSDNKLTSLLGSPRKVLESFFCRKNLLTSLIYGPKIVKLYYSCGYNNIISLEGYPDELGEYFYCSGNPIYEIYKLFNSNYNLYKDSLDYNYLRGDCIIKLRFQEALEEIDVMEIPESIPGYKYI